MVRQKIGIGLLGLGNVGQGVVTLLRKNADVIEQRSGKKIEVISALVRNPDKPRTVDNLKLTMDPDEVINDPDVDIVVELLGGLDPAYKLVVKALEVGKHVVTANKTLIAFHGEEILELGEKVQRYVGFEAAVCAGIPLIRSLMEGLVANRITGFTGIVNGTTNFILSRMAEEGLSYEEALALAQERGFAEPDPTADVSGADVAQKLSIMAKIAFSAQVSPDQVPRLGIESIETDDEHAAREFGYTIKMLAHGQRRNGTSLDLRVHPTLVPLDHPLAGVRDENNAVLLHGDAVEDILFYGKGAGALPTASGVLSDVVDIAGSHGFFASIHIRTTATPIEPPPLPHYLRFVIADKPGVIGRITTALGSRGISISQANAHLPRGAKSPGRIRILTHPVERQVLAEVLEEIGTWPDVEKQPLALPLLA